MTRQADGGYLLRAGGGEHEQTISLQHAMQAPTPLAHPPLQAPPSPSPLNPVLASHPCPPPHGTAG